MLPSSRPSSIREKLTILGSHLYIPKNLKTLQSFFKKFDFYICYVQKPARSKGATTRHICVSASE